MSTLLTKSLTTQQFANGSTSTMQYESSSPSRVDNVKTTPDSSVTSDSPIPNGIVLVVDDEPIGLEVVKALLHDSGYQLHFAANGYEALAKAKNLRPDLILLDVLMPGLSGYDVCREIRANSYIADIPIILLTALNDREAKIQGIQAGADDFITKPFDRLELRVRVRTILRLNRYRRLMSERAKFGWVVEAADDGYLLIDPNDTIEYANPRALSLLELETYTDPTSFLEQAQTIFQLPSPTWHSWPAPSEQPRHLVRPQTQSAETLWLQVDVMRDEVAANQSYLVRLRDVTNEIGQQRLTWTFHAQIQHKFRHPLSTLTGHLEILKYGDQLTSAEREIILNRAINSSNRLKDEILSVLDFLAVSDRPTPKKQSCTIENALSLAEHLNEQFEQVTVLVNSLLATHVPIHLSMSCGNLQTILWELVGNAQKFHPEQTPNIDIHFARAGKNIRILVQDDGVGLPHDQLQQIWTPYYQAEPYFTGQIPGMGLGLAMVSSLVWSVGGTCRAYNREDQSGLVIELMIPTI